MTGVVTAMSTQCPALTAEQYRDAEIGMAWWNGLTKAERAHWLDRAWKRAAPQYTLDSMPSAADAWAEFQRQPKAADKVVVAAGRAAANESHDAVFEA